MLLFVLGLYSFSGEIFFFVPVGALMLVIINVTNHKLNCIDGVILEDLNTSFLQTPIAGDQIDLAYDI